MIHATVIGNLGGDAETKTLASGKVVTNFSIAAKDRRNNDTSWVRCSMWGVRGSKVAQFLTKGKLIAAHGALITRAAGEKNYLDLDVAEIELLSKRESEDAPF